MVGIPEFGISVVFSLFNSALKAGFLTPSAFVFLSNYSKIALSYKYLNIRIVSITVLPFSRQ